MYWTKEKPKTEGWYWFRKLDTSGSWREEAVFISKTDEIPDGYFYAGADVFYRLSQKFKTQFSSEPIQKPVDR